MEKQITEIKVDKKKWKALKIYCLKKDVSLIDQLDKILADFLNKKKLL